MTRQGRGGRGGAGIIIAAGLFALIGGGCRKAESDAAGSGYGAGRPSGPVIIKERPNAPLGQQGLAHPETQPHEWGRLDAGAIDAAPGPAR